MPSLTLLSHLAEIKRGSSSLVVGLKGNIIKAIDSDAELVDDKLVAIITLFEKVGAHEEDYLPFLPLINVDSLSKMEK